MRQHFEPNKLRLERHPFIIPKSFKQIQNPLHQRNPMPYTRAPFPLVLPFKERYRFKLRSLPVLGHLPLGTLRYIRRYSLANRFRARNIRK
ncbi:unnamed protein product [Phyllotreta striolata]|uniref:Uncharacterized protein n=1 Tax=Phyllotreta striolata TaxID=444603 RepID=A0A9N9XRH5_PHYSR|nr:unnamed protein product [Phyllotreta striolata]